MSEHEFRKRKDIERDIRSESGVTQPQNLRADIQMRILEVLLDIRDQIGEVLNRMEA